MHTDHIVVAKAKLVVGQKGRERVLRERCKNVHAGVRGLLLYEGREAEELFQSMKSWVALYYNPYLTTHFIRRATNEPVFRAGLVYLGPPGPWYVP